jgi:hypothetical protein
MCNVIVAYDDDIILYFPFSFYKRMVRLGVLSKKKY